MNPPGPMLPEPDSTMEVGPNRVAQWIGLPADQRPCLIDCRERSEIAICRIAGSEWIPLAEFPGSLERIRDLAGRGVVVCCHHGMRSLHATQFLRARGVECSFSLAGGIDLWAREIEPSMARY